MKITVLSENTCLQGNYGTEHGLSLFIETENKKILFDTGQSSLFYENAVKMNVDLSGVDFAVLSHGHYDHSGGLNRFLEVNSTAPVYLSRYAFGDYYNANGKYIGVNKSIRNSSRLVFTEKVFSVAEGITLYSCNELPRRYFTDTFGLTELCDAAYQPDSFLHEQYLEIRENGKSVLISGCSHKGILNIADWFMPDVLVGGFHFSKLQVGKELKRYAQCLASFNTDFYTCHCTGTEQFAYMKKYMQRLEYISTGDTIKL